MSRDKQMFNDLVEIFDEEYGRRNLITPQNTAEKLTAKGYRKASEVALEVIGEIEQNFEIGYGGVLEFRKLLAELKKKYTEREKDNG